MVDFWPAEDTVNAYIGFRTELWIDYPQYRIELDLNRQPTMETVTLYHGMLRETVMLSPVSLQIKGLDNEVEHLVIHYQDGSSYVVVDEENCVYGWAGQSGIMHRDDGWQIGYLLSNIIDINQVSYVQVDGNNYVPQNP